MYGHGMLLPCQLMQLGYNFLYGLWLYQWDADCELFLKILVGEIREEVYLAQTRLCEELEELFAAMDKAKGQLTGQIPKASDKTGAEDSFFAYYHYTFNTRHCMPATFFLRSSSFLHFQYWLCMHPLEYKIRDAYATRFHRLVNLQAELRIALHAYFKVGHPGGKTMARFDQLMQGLEEDQPGSNIEWKKIFEEDREFNQGEFAETVRDQFLEVTYNG